MEQYDEEGKYLDYALDNIEKEISYSEKKILKF